MINPLNELSAVYVEHIAEQQREPVHSYRSGGNEPGDVKTKVSQMVKAIRYKSQKEGGNMIKAFNDYMGGQSGVGSAERQMVKQKLGLQEDNEVVNEDAEQKKRELVRKHSQAALGDVKSYKKLSQASKNYVKKIQAEKQRKEEGKRGRWDERVPTKEENEVVDEYIDTVKKVKKAELDQDIERWKENVNEASYPGYDEKGKKKDDRLTVTHADRKGNTPAYQRYKAGDKRYKAADHLKNEDKDWGYDKKGQSLNPADIEKRKRKEDKLFGSPKVKKESYETKKTSEVIKALSKKKGDFKKRYGKDAPDVMYAVAAKTAKKKGDTSKSDDRYAYEEVVHEGKCDDCTCEGCGPDGVGHQNPCVECGGHHKEMKEGFSNWREDLREIADDIPETEKKMEVKIKEKNVKNKIVINPVLGEEIKKIGGELLEMSEVEEQVAAGGAVPLSTQEIMIAKRQAMLNTRASKARQRTISKVKAEKEVKEELSDRAKKEVERDARNADNPLHKPGRRTLKQLTYARELALKNQKKKVTSEEVKDKQGLDKYDRHKRMIRHKQDKYGRNVVGADYNLENERKAKGWKKKLNKEDKAFDNVVSMLRKKHGDSSVITKDSPKPKAQPQPKRKPQKDTRSAAQREVDAQYGRTPWNKKGSLGT